MQKQKRVKQRGKYKTHKHTETKESQIKNEIQNSHTYRNNRDANKKVNTKLTYIQKQKRVTQRGKYKTHKHTETKESKIKK